jgi:membrane protein YqaA with SNARE-associated domain
VSVAGAGSTADAGSRPFAVLERLAEGRAGLVLVSVWAFAEAILLPVVPDIAACLLALAVPRRTLALFVALVAGSLAGTAVLYALAIADPDAVSSMLLALPGINSDMLRMAQQLVASGDPLSIAQLGPGTPLKVYTVAWAAGPAAPLALAVGVILNRITRIAPGLLLAAAAGWLAPAFIRRHDRLILAGYAAFWIVAYALYLR